MLHPLPGYSVGSQDCKRPGAHLFLKDSSGASLILLDQKSAFNHDSTNGSPCPALRESPGTSGCQILVWLNTLYYFFQIFIFFLTLLFFYYSRVGI